MSPCHPSLWSGNHAHWSPDSCWGAVQMLMPSTHSKGPFLSPLAASYTAGLVPENLLVLFSSTWYPATHFQQFRSHDGKWGQRRVSLEPRTSFSKIWLWKCDPALRKFQGHLVEWLDFWDLSPWLSFSLFPRFCKCMKNQSVSGIDLKMIFYYLLKLLLNTFELWNDRGEPN